MTTMEDRNAALAQQMRRNHPHIDVTLVINGEKWEFKNASGSAWMLKYDGNGSPYLLADGERIVIGKYSEETYDPR